MKEKSNHKRFLFISWLITGVFYQYMLCHIAALVSGGSGYVGALMEFMEHITRSPFDIFYFDKLVYGFGWLIYLSILLILFTRPEKVRGEMDGIEHGSSRFQTPEDIKIFLKKFSTPILPYEPPVIVDELDEDEEEE